jgi:hypothetical protein
MDQPLARRGADGVALLRPHRRSLLPASVPLGPEPFRLDLTGHVADTADLSACESIFVGPDFDVEAGGVVALTAGRRIVVSPVSSVKTGGRLELATGSPRRAAIV